MSGCTNCGGKGACEDRKGLQLAYVEETLAHLYPTRTWGALDDVKAFGAGISEEEGRRLARELRSELRAATFFHPGDELEHCHYVYILCVGREPCLAELRITGAPIPEEPEGHGETLDELYLRLCLSTLGRMAVVQQVALRLAREEDELLFSSRPRGGVYDPPLLPRFQKLVAALAVRDIRHLDLGEISEPPAGYAPGDYPRLYGGEPAIVNYLFFPQPSGMAVATLG